MAFLYGDSSESGLEVNYIEYLKAVLDLAVEVLLVEHRLHALQQAGDERKRAAEAELAELRQVSDAIGRAIEATPGGPDSAAQRCAAVIRGAAADALKQAVAALKAQVGEQTAEQTRQVQVERASATRALEAFLVRHDPPGGERQLDLTLDASGAGYLASSRGRADVGLDWRLALDIPGGHLFAQPLKLERVAPHLEIRVPETGGWMRKGTRLKSQRMGGQYLVDLTDSPQQTCLKLRVGPQDDEAGYNLLVQRGGAPIRLVRVSKGGEHSPPFEPLDDDVPRLLELSERLRGELAELAAHRKALLAAHLDGKPIGEPDAASLAVRRLLTHLAPVIHEIARRSLSADELVLKRVLADGRREEIFVAKADLLARLEAVPARLRALFQPLGLDAPAAPPAAPRPRRRPSDDSREITISSVEVVIDEPSVQISPDLISSTAPATRESAPASSPGRGKPLARLRPRPVAAGERAAPRPEPVRPPTDDDVTVVASAPPPPQPAERPAATDSASDAARVDALLSELERDPG